MNCNDILLMLPTHIVKVLLMDNQIFDDKRILRINELQLILILCSLILESVIIQPTRVLLCVLFYHLMTSTVNYVKKKDDRTDIYQKIHLQFDIE